MSEELDFIPVEADDFEDVKHALFSVDDSLYARCASSRR